MFDWQQKDGWRILGHEDWLHLMVDTCMEVCLDVATLHAYICNIFSSSFAISVITVCCLPDSRYLCHGCAASLSVSSLEQRVADLQAWVLITPCQVYKSWNVCPHIDRLSNATRHGAVHLTE